MTKNPAFEVSGAVVDSSNEAVVYLVQSPKYGLQYRFYAEEDILSEGGIQTIEQFLRRESLWFMRVGVIEAKYEGGTTTFTNEAIASLPASSPGDRQIGRLNPSFGLGEIERQIFDSMFEFLSNWFEQWTIRDGTIIEAYAIKEVRVTSNRLSCLASTLLAAKDGVELVELIVLKHWYGGDWLVRVQCDELIIAEFPLTVPIRVRWAKDTALIVTEILHPSDC